MSAPKLTRRSIIQYTMQLGFSTIISKALGFVREILLARYLGVGPLADAFFTAFRTPNSLRKIFAEGALSAAFVPTITQVISKEGKEKASAVTTNALLIVQSLLLLLCCMAAVYASFCIGIQVPGWLVQEGVYSERFIASVALFKILVFFIFFISASSVLAGVLQGDNKFSISAWGQIATNILWIVQLSICAHYHLSIYAFAWMVLVNGFLYLLLHYVFYRAAGFTLQLNFNATTWRYVWHALAKFIPCALGFGAVEINLYIDQLVASYLPEGSLSLLNYTQGFVRLPLGVFAVALGTILLPHFSRVGLYAPRRMGYYILESTKLVLWVTLPMTLMMSFFAYPIFYTTYYSFSDKFALEYVQQAAYLLMISIAGLFFFSLNKIIINVFYALHETRWPTIITLVSTICNTILNIVGMNLFGIYGIVLATSLAAALQVIMMLFILYTRMRLPFYGYALWRFIKKYCAQLLFTAVPFYLLHMVLYWTISMSGPFVSYWFLHTILYWLWVGPLCCLFMLVLYLSRNRWDLRMHFLD